DVGRFVLLLPRLAEGLDRRRVVHALEVAERLVLLLPVAELVDPSLWIVRVLLAPSDRKDREDRHRHERAPLVHGSAYRFFLVMANITSVYSAAYAVFITRFNTFASTLLSACKTTSPRSFCLVASGMSCFSKLNFSSCSRSKSSGIFHSVD